MLELVTGTLAAPARESGPEAVVETRDFRAAMRELAGAVSVITVGAGQERTGFTATSVTSLSVDPPTLLVSANRRASTFPVLQRLGAFAVNVLAAGQREVAGRFAGLDGAKGVRRYDGAHWSTLVTGSPVLAGALATFDCVVEELIERHSHAIVIGRVTAIRIGPRDPALVYWRGDYDRIGWTEEEAGLAVGLS
ncbi:MAG: flavin reductase family protein [Alsobacter sp.]